MNIRTAKKGFFTPVGDRKSDREDRVGGKARGVAESKGAHEKTARVPSSFCESVREGGREVARLSVSLPPFDEKYASINAFYFELCENIRCWFFDEYAERARTEYLSSEDAKKEYTFRRYEYSLSGEVKLFDTEYLSLVLRVHTGRRGRGEKITERQLSQCWRLSDGALLPPEAFLKSHKDRKMLFSGGKKCDGFYLGGGEAVLFFLDRDTGKYEEKPLCSHAENREEKSP